MLTMAKQRPFSVFAAAVAVVVVACSARGQDTSGKSVLLEAVDAARDLRALSADVVLSGAGSGMFQAYIPTGRGTLRLSRQDEPVDGRSWFTRFDGTYIHKKGDPEQRITSLRTPELLAWVDHEKKSVEERSSNNRRAQAASIIDLFGVPELTAPEPFSRELREATSWKKLDRAEADGVLCDVVEIRYDMSKSNRNAGGTLIRTPASKWYFGVEDHLPRRVERITDEGMLSFTIVLDLKNVKVNPEITPGSLAIETPEGYSRTQHAEQISADEVNAPLKEEIDARRAAEAAEAAAPFPKDLPAHGFELVDGEGNDVSLESLKGNVAVLYFWGTWCVPCKAFSPLISDLAERYEGEPVRVFGLPVRERDEQAVRDVMSRYKHTLLLNPKGKPVGCDATARAYKVRRYPTIYVIGFDSEVLAVKWPTKDKEPSEIVDEVADLIDAYLKSRG